MNPDCEYCPYAERANVQNGPTISASGELQR